MTPKEFTAALSQSVKEVELHAQRNVIDSVRFYYDYQEDHIDINSIWVKFPEDTVYIRWWTAAPLSTNSDIRWANNVIRQLHEMGIEADMNPIDHTIRVWFDEDDYDFWEMFSKRTWI